MITYCPPGRKVLTELVLALSGEYADEVVETPLVERDILLVADSPELLIGPVFTADTRPAPALWLYRIPVATPTTICLIRMTP